MNSAIVLFADKLSTIDRGQPGNLFRKIALGCKSPFLKCGAHNGSFSWFVCTDFI